VNTDLVAEPPAFELLLLLLLLLDDEPQALSASTTPTAAAAIKAVTARLLVGMELVLSFIGPSRSGQVSLVGLLIG
jgi:hypothetical protein